MMVLLVAADPHHVLMSWIAWCLPSLFIALMMCIPDPFISALVSTKKSSLSLVSMMVLPVVGVVVMIVA